METLSETRVELKAVRLLGHWAERVFPKELVQHLGGQKD